MQLYFQTLPVCKCPHLSNFMPQVHNCRLLIKCVFSSPIWENTDGVTVTSSVSLSPILESPLQSHTTHHEAVFTRGLVTYWFLSEKLVECPLKSSTCSRQRGKGLCNLIRSGSTRGWFHINLLNLEFPLNCPISKIRKSTHEHVWHCCTAILFLLVLTLLWSYHMMLSDSYRGLKTMSLTFHSWPWKQHSTKQYPPRTKNKSASGPWLQTVLSNLKT